MSRMTTVIVEKCRKSSVVKKYDFCVVEHNLGKLDTKARVTGWLSVWSVSRMWRMSQEMAPSSSPLPRQRCCWDVMLFLSRLLRDTLAGRGRGRGGAQFRAIITGQRLAEFNKTTISWSGGIFLTKKIQNTWESNSSCCFTMAWCWNCDVGLGDWPLRNNATNYKRICPEMLRECLIWDVLRCIGRSNASIARTKLSVTHNFDELLKLSQQQWH